MDEKLVKLLEFIAKNSELESIWLSPNQVWINYTEDMVNEIVKIWELDKEEVSKIVEASNES